MDNQALAEKIVRILLGFTDSEEDVFMWKWQSRTVEVARMVNRVKNVLDEELTLSKAKGEMQDA